MAFDSWADFFKFRRNVSAGNRFIRDEEAEIFIRNIEESCKRRTKNLASGSRYWRSQIGSDFNYNLMPPEPCPYNLERMKPKSNSAFEGRINSKGTPCLYLASEKETAIAEVRPWVGTLISVSQFELLSDVNLVDCSINHKDTPIYSDEPPTDKEKEDAVWAYIDDAFSTPIVTSDYYAHYLVTQIISEVFKANNFDGIIFKSSVSEGHNLALFDLDIATPISCELQNVDNISFEFSEWFSPYMR